MVSLAFAKSQLQRISSGCQRDTRYRSTTSESLGLRLWRRILWHDKPELAKPKTRPRYNPEPLTCSHELEVKPYGETKSSVYQYRFIGTVESHSTPKMKGESRDGGPSSLVRRTRILGSADSGIDRGLQGCYAFLRPKRARAQTKVWRWLGSCSPGDRGVMIISFNITLCVTDFISFFPPLRSRSATARARATRGHPSTSRAPCSVSFGRIITCNLPAFK